MTWPIILRRIIATIAGGGGIPWLSVLQLFLTIADTVANIVREKQLMDAGEAKATATQLAAIAKRAGITDEIRAAVGKLTDAEIDDELGKTDPL